MNLSSREEGRTSESPEFLVPTLKLTARTASCLRWLDCIDDLTPIHCHTPRRRFSQSAYLFLSVSLDPQTQNLSEGPGVRLGCAKHGEWSAFRHRVGNWSGPRALGTWTGGGCAPCGGRGYISRAVFVAGPNKHNALLIIACADGTQNLTHCLRFIPSVRTL